MKFRSAIAVVALLASCASAGSHPLPSTVQAHLDSARVLPDGVLAVGCSPESPCLKVHGTWYPPELAAHLATAESCCVDCLKDLRKVDRAGVDTVTVIFSVIAGGIAAGLTVAAGYEFRDYLKK